MTKPSTRSTIQIANEEALGIQRNSVTDFDLKQRLKRSRTRFHRCGDSQHLFQSRHISLRSYEIARRLGSQSGDAGKNQHMVTRGNPRKQADQSIINLDGACGRV